MPEIKMKNRLGRGLQSLMLNQTLPVSREISATKDVAAEKEKKVDTGLLDLPVADILPNPSQPRKLWNDASLSELAISIRESGLVQPIVVRETAKGYELVAGERRLRAAKLAGLLVIPAILRDIDSSTQAVMALVENTQREDLNPIDRANAYRSLLKQLGLTQQQLAEKIGEDRSAIANHLRLFDLADNVQDMVQDGRLSLGHAKLLASISDLARQTRLAETCVSQSLSVRNLERILAQPETLDVADTPGKSISHHLDSLEKSIARQIGLRVQVKSRAKGKGRMIIHYGNLDQFDELLVKLGVQIED